MKTIPFKIPNRVTLPGLKIEIVKMKMVSEYGQSDDDNARIFIDPSEPITVQRETLLHELQHMIHDYAHACRLNGIAKTGGKDV